MECGLNVAQRLVVFFGSIVLTYLYVRMHTGMCVRVRMRVHVRGCECVFARTRLRTHMA